MKRSTILGACFLAFVTTFSTVRAAEMPEMADLIIYNAKVLTVNSNFTVASAIAVKGDRVLAVGRDRRLEEFRGPETRIVDAQGRTIMPGLYDADEGSYVTAISELGGSLPDIDCISNAQAYIRREASNTPAGKWIMLAFISPTRLKEGRLPTKEELDAATTNTPVLWIFGPTAVVNSKALEVSKIDKDTPSPAGGEIVKDPKHHKPTGLLRNTAIIMLKLPKPDQPPTAAQERAALKHLYSLYNEQGITSIGEVSASPAAIDLFRDMARSNELTVRINCGRYFSPSKDADESIDRLTAFTNAPAGKLPYGPTGVGDDWVRIGPLLTMIDGNSGMGTAYLRTPYGIGPTFMIDELAYRGPLLQDAFALPQVYLAAAQQGWQLETHAAGDAALDFVLNAYQQVQFKFDITDRRFLIAHSEFQASQDWRRCQDLGVGVILRPTLLYDDGANLERALGTNRLTYYLPFKSWFDRNIVAGGGSGHVIGLDSRNTPSAWNPWLGMWVTLTRETRSGEKINPEEKLTREQAIRLYTFNNAWLHGEEKQKGSLEPGKLADLVMLDTDIMKCPLDDIPNAKVLFTMVNGKVVWQAIEPIFPGPQVIPAMTINVTNTPATVAVATPGPVVPTPVNNQSAAAAAKHAAEATTGVNPYAPVADAAPAPVAAAPVSPAPVNTLAPLSATTTSNAAPTVATTVQPVSDTNSAASTTTASAPTVSTNSTTLAAQSDEAKPDTTASTGASSGFAGAAPAEVAANQSTTTSAAPAATTVTNQAPAAPATNAVPSATTTNAANSVTAPNQPAVAATATPAPATTAVSPAQDTSATTTQAAAATTADTTAATPAASTATTTETPAANPPATGPTQVAAATTTTATTSTTTNDAPASNNQDWSKVGTGAK